MAPDGLSRRDVLRLSPTALLGLAGCSAGTTDADERDSATPTAGEPEFTHSVDSPKSATVRNPEGNPAVRSSARSPEENAFESAAAWNYEDWLITSPREGDALEFSDSATGVDSTTALVADTDFSQETLLVHQYNVPACETRRPVRIRWGGDFTCGDVECVGIRLQYDRRQRGDDCESSAESPPYPEGTYDSEAAFVRVPAQIQSYGRFGYQV